MEPVFDDIIVGAGSCGAVLAARLSEQPEHRVLLLEAGPDYPSVSQTPPDLLDCRRISIVAHDWGLTALAAAQREIPYPRGKVVGGSSAVNASVALRGVPADYDEWAALGNDAWGWDQVLPYFRKLEADLDESGPFHGEDGPTPIRRWRLDEWAPVQRAYLDDCSRLGFPVVRDHNDPEASGVGAWPMNMRDGIRISTAIAYLLPARGRGNLTIHGDCLVHRVLFDGDRAIGVEADRHGAVEQIYGERITLAAGAIGSPAILMRSGVGPAEPFAELGIRPRLDLPGVGANLIDHPAADVFVVPRAGVCSPDQPGVQIGLRYTAPGSVEFNDMQLYMYSWWDLGSAPSLEAAIGASAAFMIFPVLQRPKSRGQISLASSDAHIPPVIELNYLSQPEDLKRMADGLRLAWQLAHGPAISALAERVGLLTDAMVASEESLEAYLRARVRTLFHPVGSARMGPDGDALAAVDQFGRVRGFSGLRVVDASIMPAIPRANTNLTCIMMAERLADWMRAEF